MNLQLQLFARILIIAFLCLFGSAAYVLYETDQQAIFEAEQTAKRIEHQMQNQLLQMFQRNDFSRQFPDINLKQEIQGIPGSCTQFLSRTQSRQRSLCNDSTEIAQNWPDWFSHLYQKFFHPDIEVRKSVNFNAIRYGTVLVSLNVQMETARAWNNLQAVLGVMSVTILAFCILMFVTIYHMLKPAQHIVKGLERMREGHLDTRLPSFELAEWKRTSEAINALAQTQQHTILENQRLALKLIKAQEEEHRYISRELHDEFGQCLAGINAVTTSISHTVKKSCPEVLAEVSSISQITAHMMTALRDLLTRLRPTEVDDMGLESSLKKLIRSWNQRTGKQTNFTLQINGHFDQLPAPLPINIYRIVQECLTNIAKHAHATQACVRLESISENNMMLLIEDDGVATNENFEPDVGHGLIGINERVNALGGTCTLSSESQGGMRVRINIPLNQSMLLQEAND